jgi:hypothetical protein
MFKKARPFSLVEIEYLQKHAEDPVTQLCISLSQTKNQVTKKLAELSGKEPSKKKKSSLPGNTFHSKIGKRPDLGIFLRSGWECDIMRLLRSGLEGETTLIEYEPTDFAFYPWGIIKGTVSYTPDFKVTWKDGTYNWLEVKGFLKSFDKVKMKRFKKYYPEEAKHLMAITGSANNKTTAWFVEQGIPVWRYFNDMKKKYRKVIPFWESQ